MGQDGVREAVRLDGAGALQMVMAGTQILRHLIRVGAVLGGLEGVGGEILRISGKVKGVGVQDFSALF